MEEKKENEKSHIVYLLPRLWGKFLPQLHQWRNCPPVHFFLHGPWWNLCDHLCPLSLLKENNHVKQHHKIGRWMINNDPLNLLFVFTAINIEKNKTFRPILGRSCRFIFNVGTWLWTSGRMCFIFRCGSISSSHHVIHWLTDWLIIAPFFIVRFSSTPRSIPSKSKFHAAKVYSK